MILEKTKMRCKTGYILWIAGLFAMCYLGLKLSATSGTVKRNVKVSRPSSDSVVRETDVSKTNIDFLDAESPTRDSNEFEVLVGKAKAEIEADDEKQEEEDGDREQEVDESEYSDAADDKDQSTESTEEVQHVAFLKVHKTASSTAQNVFLRFGDSRKLNFVLPHVKGESGWPNVISYNHSITSTNIVPAPKGEHFDVMCCHVLYNREQFQKVLPADTVYIGIVREPVSRFQSAVKYFSPRYILKIQGAHPLSIFLRNPMKYERDDPRESQLNNRMATEFGFPLDLFPGKSLNGSQTEIKKYLDKLDKEFKFIIISERFDESMVMMRRLLNWKIRDVLYIDKNVGSAKPNPKKLLQDTDTLPVRQFLYLDDALYNWSVQRFAKQIAAEGEDFQEELEFFQKTREKVKEFCKTSQSTLTVEASQWEKGFSVHRSDCVNFFKHEKDMILRQRVRMYGTEIN